MVEINTLKLNKKVKEKYSIKNNTFAFIPKDNNKDRIETEIGDIKQLDFHPQVKIKRWDNEVNFSVRLKHEEENPIISSKDEKINWKGDKIEVDFYDIKEGEGGYEFEVTLKEKPVTNKVEFSLNTKGLNFYYQPELTQEEKNQGHERPENIVGSYAVYASEEKLNYIGGKEYKTGKVGHIYRPRIEDANGDWVWGELKIEKETLSVTIPQEFLDNAVYPIKHASGLTIGYTSTGGSYTNFSANNMTGNKNTGASGTGNSMSVYCAGEANSKARIGLYLNSDDSLLAYTNETGVTGYASPEWKTMTFVSEPSLNTVDYKFEIFVGVNIVRLWYDVTAGVDRYQKTSGQTYPTFPDTFSGYTTYNDSLKFSLYLTYTAISGPAKLKTRNGLEVAKIKTINGLEIGKSKTIDGLS